MLGEWEVTFIKVVFSSQIKWWLISFILKKSLSCQLLWFASFSTNFICLFIYLDVSGLSSTWNLLFIMQDLSLLPMDSPVVACGLSSAVFGFSCSSCGILVLWQGSNPSLLHCKATSYPLDHQGSPTFVSLFIPLNRGLSWWWMMEMQFTTFAAFWSWGSQIAESPFLPLVACCLTSVYEEMFWNLYLKNSEKELNLPCLKQSGLCFSQGGSIGIFQKEKDGKGNRRYLTDP